MGICVGNAFLFVVFFFEWVYTLWGENEKNLYVFLFCFCRARHPLQNSAVCLRGKACRTYSVDDNLTGTRFWGEVGSGRISDKSLLLESPWAQRFELLVEMLLNFLGFDVEGASYPLQASVRGRPPSFSRFLGGRLVLWHRLTTNKKRSEVRYSFSRGLHCMRDARTGRCWEGCYGMQWDGRLRDCFFSAGSLSMPGGFAIVFFGGEAFAGSLFNEARAQQAWVYVLVLVCVMALLVGGTLFDALFFSTARLSSCSTYMYAMRAGW